MKFLTIVLLLATVGCQKSVKSSSQNKIGTPETIIQPQVSESILQEEKKTVGRICDLYDPEEHEIYRVFLEDRDGAILFNRLNDREDLANPTLRTTNLDLYEMFKVRDHTNYQVSIIERIDLKDRGVWKSYSEIINATVDPVTEGYTLHRTRYLRDKKKYTEKDWEESYPEPFTISGCREASVKVGDEFLPKRRNY